MQTLPQEDSNLRWIITLLPLAMLTTDHIETLDPADFKAVVEAAKEMAESSAQGLQTPMSVDDAELQESLCEALANKLKDARDKLKNDMDDLRRYEREAASITRKIVQYAKQWSRYKFSIIRQTKG